MASAAKHTRSKPRRPVVRWFGGKWRLAPWIIENLPAHDCYCELFGGGAGVLLRKDPARVEIYNDLDADVVNLFRVLRDPHKAAELERAVRLTPYARDELRAAFYTQARTDVERARSLLVKSWLSMGATGATRPDGVTGLRVSLRSNRDPCKDWTTWPDAIPSFVARLRGVTIENKDAAALAAQLDTHATLFYADPPYLGETRSERRATCGYRHELATEAQHKALAQVLRGLRGMVVLSGYDSPLYTRLYGDWKTKAIDTRDMNANAKRELLWFNPAAWDALHSDMFSHLRK